MIFWEKMTFDDVCLLLITLQGFGIMWFEWRVYVLHNERFNERRKWREAKARVAVKKNESKIVTEGQAPVGSLPSDGSPMAKNL